MLIVVVSLFAGIITFISVLTGLLAVLPEEGRSKFAVTSALATGSLATLVTGSFFIVMTSVINSLNALNT